MPYFLIWKKQQNLKLSSVHIIGGALRVKVFLLCLLRNFAHFCVVCRLAFSQKFFQEYHQSAKQIRSSSDLTFCLANKLHYPVIALILGLVKQSVASPSADPGVVSLIPAQSHTFVEIHRKIISTVILLLLLIQEGFCQLQAKVCAQSTR